jgi:hypothetical protein
VNPYAVKYGLGRAWGSSVLSLGLWPGYWLHRQRKLFDGELGHGRDDAIFHSIGLFVPILNVFVLYWFYRDLDDLRRRIGLSGISVPGYVIGAVFAAPIVYSIAIGKVNELWDVRTGGLAVEAPRTTAETVVLAAGAGLWLLYIMFVVLFVLLAAFSGSVSYVV